MTGDVAIPLHLAVHVLGLTVAASLAVHALARRARAGPGWWALVVGGVLLAISHVVAGAVLAPGLVWPVYLRAAGYAALALGSAGRLVGAPAALVLVAPPGAYIAAAVAGAAASIASLRGVLGRGRDTLMLAAGIAAWAFADLLSRGDPTIAGVVSLAGSATVGGSLLWRARESLLSRIVAALLGALLLLVVVLGSAGGIVFGGDLQRDELRALETAVTSRVDAIADEWRAEVLTVAGLVADDTLAVAIADGSEARLDGLARTIGQLPGADVVVLVAMGGDVVASYDARTRGAMDPSAVLFLSQEEVTEQALRGSVSRAVLALGGEDVLVVGANPVVPRVDGEPRHDLQAGAVIVGRRVSDRRFVDEVADNAGAGASVVSGGVVLESTLGRRARADLATALGDGTRSRVVSLDGEPTLVAAARIPATGDDAWLVLTRRTATLASVQLSFTRTLFLATAAGLGVAALLAAWSVSRTTRPVRRLTTAAERVAAGERNVRTGIDQPDEVGRLAVAFDDMTAALATREEELVAAAATEAALRARLEVLTASIGEGLIAVTSDGRVQTVNPAAESMLRASSGRLIGRPVREVLEGRDGAGGSLLEALGEPTHTDIRAVRGSVGAGQSAVAVAATAAPLRGADGEVLGRVYVLRDVSGEVEVERMKTEFLANISHELRTPLTPIKGYAEVLRRKEIGFERTSEFAANISAATDRLERIIGMLVDFAALEAGRVDVNVEPTRLGAVVDTTLAAWRTKVPERKFARRLAARLPEVAVDPALLMRVLEELIDNAVKFSDGPITLRAQREGDRVRLTVHDTGGGIEPEQLEVIARDFHQADGSATRRHGGLGLGLSLVQRISERFDAIVEIDSRPGAGTDASLLLRIAGSGARS